MKKLFTLALLSLCLFFSINLSAQTFYTDNCTGGTILGWDNANSSYSLTQANGELTFDVNWGNTSWVGIYNDLQSQTIDVSTNPFLTVKIKAPDRPFVLTSYLFDATGNHPISQRVLPSDNFVTLTYDYTGSTSVDLSAITGIQFTCSGLSRGYTGTMIIDDLQIGTSAIKTAALGGQTNKVYYINSGSKTILLTDIANADNISVSGAVGIVSNLNVTAISNGQATVSFDLVTDAVGTGTIVVSANGSAGFTNNSMNIDITIEDNNTPIITQVINQELASGSNINVQLDGISDGNLSKEQIVSITASSDNQAAVANGDIVVDYTSDSPKGVLTITGGSVGTANITVTVTDNGVGSNFTTMIFATQVYQSINNVPTIGAIEKQTSYGTSPQQKVTVSGLSDGDNFAQTLTVSATSSAPGIAVIDSVSYSNGSPTAILYYSPVANGTTTITVTAQDDGGDVNNNGNKSVSTTFDIDIITAPVTGRANEFDTGNEGWWFTGGSGSASGGVLTYTVNKGKWDPFGVSFNPHMDITANPYITVMAKASANVDLAMWYFDGAGNYSNNNPQRMHITTSWQEYTFNYTDPNNQMTGGGVVVDIADATSMHCLIAPGSTWTGTVDFDYIRIGDYATRPTFDVLIDTLPYQSIFEGSSAVTLNLTGISDGDVDDDVVSITATSNNTTLIPNPVVSAIVDGKATLTYNPAASGTGTAIITVTATANSSNPRVYTFNIEVLANNIGNAQTVSLDYGVTHQTIEGFGAYGYNADYLKEYYEDLGASAIRLGFIGKQIERVNDNSDPNELNREALDYTAFDWNILKELHENGVETFILTAWSPPAWMKENLAESYAYAGAPNYETTTNKLLPEYYDEYAEMWVAAVKLLKEESNVDLYAIGLQNEPAFNEPYPSAILDPSNFPKVIKTVGQRLETEGINTKIYMSEQVFSQGHYSMKQYIDSLQADNEANRLTYAIATHGYASDGIGEGAASQTEWKTMYNNAQEGTYPKPMWMTETSGGENTWNDYLNAAGAIYGALKYGNVSFWTWWSFHGSVGSRGFCLIAGSEKTPRFYASKQYFKYIRPGAVRIDATSDHDSLLVVGFKNDLTHGNNTVFVVINKDNQPHTMDISVANGAAPAKYVVYQTTKYQGCKNMGAINSTDLAALPPMSITTFVSSTNLIPTIDPVNDIINTVGDGSQTLALTGITDGGDGGQTITVTAVSSDITVINNVSVDYVSPNNTATLHYDVIGVGAESSIITITVQDDGGTSGGGNDNVIETFTINIYSSFNNQPSITAISDQNILEDATTQTVNILGLDDGDGGAQTLTVNATSSNQNVCPNPAITYPGGATATLTYTPLTDSSGSSIITITVTDDGGNAGNNGNQSVTTNFTVNVTAVNDQPTINDITNPSAYIVNAGQQHIYLIGIDDNDADFVQGFTLTSSMSTTGVINIDSLYYEDHGVGNIYFTPIADGTTTVTITVTDDGGTANGGVDSKSVSFNVVVGTGGTGFNELNSKLALYPNPIKNHFFVTLSEGQFDIVKISDIRGKLIKVFELKNASNILEINTTDMKQGLYLLSVENDDVKYNTKFIIE